MSKKGGIPPVLALFAAFFAVFAHAQEPTADEGLVVRNYKDQYEAQTLAQGEVVKRKAYACMPSPYVGTSPFAFAVAPLLEAPNEKWNITGLRLSLLVGSHRAMYGVDFATLGNFSEYEMNGLGVAGLFNSVGESTGAVNLAGICNFAAFDFTGCQISGVYSATEGAFTGLQFALGNYAGSLSGLQLGIVNYAERLEGVQVGLLNYNKSSPVQFMPIMNFAF